MKKFQKLKILIFFIIFFEILLGIGIHAQIAGNIHLNLQKVDFGSNFKKTYFYGSALLWLLSTTLSSKASHADWVEHVKSWSIFRCSFGSSTMTGFSKVSSVAPKLNSYLTD